MGTLLFTKGDVGDVLMLLEPVSGFWCMTLANVYMLEICTRN